MVYLVRKYRAVAILCLLAICTTSCPQYAQASIFGESTCSKLSKKLSQSKYQSALKKNPTLKTREDWMHEITYAVAEVNYPTCFTNASLSDAKKFLSQIKHACDANPQFSSACIFSPFGKQFFPLDWL